MEIVIITIEFQRYVLEPLNITDNKVIAVALHKMLLSFFFFRHMGAYDGLRTAKAASVWVFVCHNKAAPLLNLSYLFLHEVSLDVLFQILFPVLVLAEEVRRSLRL